MLHEDIKQEMQTAMKAKETQKVEVLRGLLTAFTNELVAQKKKPDEILSDDEVLAVIKRAAKQRKDSIEQFEKGGRTELAEQEKSELVILEGYLPEMMSEEDVKKIIQSKIDALGITDKSDMGKLMGAIMPELKDKADGALVRQIVSDLLSN